MRLMSLVKDMGYLGSDIPHEEVDLKCLKHLIDTLLLVGACSREERKIILGPYECFCFEYSSEAKNASGLPARPLLMGSYSHYSSYLRFPPSEEDYSYLDNLFEHALKEELETLARYTWCTFVDLALGGAGHWDAYWPDQHREEKHRLEESVHLMLQQNMYLHEIQRASTSLNGIRDALLPLNLHTSLTEQVNHLVRTVVMKNHTITSAQGSVSYSKAFLSAAHKELESPRPENDSMTQ
ncbi:unnamed protein product [Vicia faba]|uniref:Uncharacterized protein n=1 Tax=Vicia faba TaxID=3906 RepID=A0AAV1AVC9_VICFA|nr:unnamed protein product [Vicia faba]